MLLLPGKGLRATPACRGDPRPLNGISAWRGVSEPCPKKGTNAPLSQFWVPRAHEQHSHGFSRRALPGASCSRVGGFGKREVLRDAQGCVLGAGGSGIPAPGIAPLTPPPASRRLLHQEDKATKILLGKQDPPSLYPSEGIHLNIPGGHPAWGTTHWHCCSAGSSLHGTTRTLQKPHTGPHCWELQVSIPLSPHPLSPGQLVTTATSKPPTAHTMHLQSPFFIRLEFKCQFSLFNQNTSRHKSPKSHSGPQTQCGGSTPVGSSSLQAEPGAQSQQDFNH